MIYLKIIRNGELGRTRISVTTVTQNSFGRKTIRVKAPSLPQFFPKLMRHFTESLLSIGIFASLPTSKYIKSAVVNLLLRSFSFVLRGRKPELSELDSLIILFLLNFWAAQNGSPSKNANRKATLKRLSISGVRANETGIVMQYDVSRVEIISKRCFLFALNQSL